MTAGHDVFDPRSVHTFRYDGWELLGSERTARDGGARSVEVLLRFVLEGESTRVEFVERFVFPCAPGNGSSDGVLDGALDGVPEQAPAGHDDPRLSAALEVLMVCAGTSYYKAAAPARVEGVPEWLAGFTHELYLHGLAEFALVNDLDVVCPEVSTVQSAAGVSSGHPSSNGSSNGSSNDSDNGNNSVNRNNSVKRNTPVLVAVGGGKDSIVAIEMLRTALAGGGRPDSDQQLVLGSVRTHRAIEATAQVAHLRHLVVDRELDPLLFALNERGALNGHVPVTAINSAALAVCAVLNGYGTLVMANEWSASVPMAEHRGMAVNHQWSKSLECERLLAALLPVEYFSVLRPLHEVEICRRFAALPRYFDVVTSCNRAYTAVGRAAGTRWCGDCPKCRFVYLGLAPFLSLAEMDRIFEGARLLDDPHGVDAYRSILGLSGVPPLECVGTVQESRWAMQRLAAGTECAPVWRDAAVVRALAQELSGTRVTSDPLVDRGEHAIPSTWVELLGATGLVPDSHRGDRDAAR